MSFLGTVGGLRRGGATLLRHRGIAGTAGAAALVLIGGVTFAAMHGSSHSTLADSANVTSGGNAGAGTANAKHAAAKPKPVGPLKLLSVTPASGAHGVNGGAAITLTFSSALKPSTPLPVLSPVISGKWKVSGAKATFTPASGYLPDTAVTVKIPGSMAGNAAAAGKLKKSRTISFTTGNYSVLRLQQVLTELGYLPMTWTPSGSSMPATSPSTWAGSAGGAGVSGTSLNSQVSAAFAPPAGSFSFKSGYPSELTSQWKTGADNMLVQGAIRAFESDKGLTMDGVAGPQVWVDLLSAAAKDQKNPNGYTYALAKQGPSNESLQVWHNGKKILNSPMNSGISASPTADGTFPVYLRLQFQIMKGTNPDGSKYADPVSWISYFNGGDAVHAFYRAGYGYYQSLGCVELPASTAQFLWPYMTYGTLVTVTGPVA